MYKLYRHLSPYLKAIMKNLGFAGGECRHTPTCSLYAEQALARHGYLKGTWLSVLRLLKCHPWSQGGEDALPE